MERLPILQLINNVHFARESGGEKPDPRCFSSIANQLGLDPSELLMVGDHLYKDVLGALRADFSYAVWVRRVGSFYNFNFERFQVAHPGLLHRIAEIGSLGELVALLELDS